MLKLIFASLICAFTVSCASVQSVSLTQIPAQRTNQVQATADKWSFLGITFDNDYIDQMSDQLKAKCPNGVVTGILTKDEVYAYFLVFKRQVTATGYCQSQVALSAPSLPPYNPKKKVK